MLDHHQHLFEECGRSLALFGDAVEFVRAAQTVHGFRMCHRAQRQRRECRLKDELHVHTPADAENGSRVTAFPVSARHALATAGPIGGVPGSPMPVGSASLSMMATSTSGISLIRSMR